MTIKEDIRLNYKKILVRSTNWLGDAVMSTPFFKALDEIFPEAFIEVMALAYIAPVFENNPHIDSIKILKRDRGFKALCANVISFVSRRDKNEYDLGISLPNSIGAALDLKRAGCREILGYDRGWRGFLLNRRVKFTKEIFHVHEIYYYLNLLGCFMNKNIDIIEKPRDFYFDITRCEPAYELFLSEDESLGAKKRLEKMGILADRDIILGVNPGAFFGSAKRWFTDRYKKTLEILSAKFPRLKILVFGSEKENGIGAAICSGLDKAAFNMCGATDIRELIALVSKCRLFLTNDSGAMHIAAAFNVPIVAVFGSTDHRSTYPLCEKYSIMRKPVDCSPCKRRECPVKHHLCMENISVEEVAARMSSEIERIDLCQK